MMGESKDETRGSVGVWQEISSATDYPYGVMFTDEDYDYEETLFVGELITRLLREHHNLRVTNKRGKKAASELTREVAGLYRAIQTAGDGVALIAEERVRRVLAEQRGDAVADVEMIPALASMLDLLDIDGLTELGAIAATYIDKKMGRTIVGPATMGEVVNRVFTDKTDSAGHPWEGKGAKDE